MGKRNRAAKNSIKVRVDKAKQNSKNKSDSGNWEEKKVIYKKKKRDCAHKGLSQQLSLLSLGEKVGWTFVSGYFFFRLSKKHLRHARQDIFLFFFPLPVLIVISILNVSSLCFLRFTAAISYGTIVSALEM